MLGGDFVERERLQIRITAELLQQIEKSAQKVGISKSEFCRMAIIDFISRKAGGGDLATTTQVPR